MNTDPDTQLVNYSSNIHRGWEYSQGTEHPELGTLSIKQKRKGKTQLHSSNYKDRT